MADLSSETPEARTQRLEGEIVALRRSAATKAGWLSRSLPISTVIKAIFLPLQNAAESFAAIRDEPNSDARDVARAEAALVPIEDALATLAAILPVSSEGFVKDRQMVNGRLVAASLTTRQMEALGAELAALVNVE